MLARGSRAMRVSRVSRSIRARVLKLEYQYKRTFLTRASTRLMFVEWPVDPRHLVTLAEVVRLGSFAAAADSLGYTQSAVSQQIGELERRVGERVVERRPVRVTAAGEVLLVAERRMQATMASVAAELDAITAGVTGQVRLGA